MLDKLYTLHVLTIYSEGPTLSGEKHSNVVYDISCCCGKFCIGNTTRGDWRLGLRITGMQAWCGSLTGQPPWSMLGPRLSHQLERGKNVGLCSLSYWTGLKMLHIQMTPESCQLNHIEGYGMLGAAACSTSMKKLEKELTWATPWQLVTWSYIILSVWLIIKACMFWHMHSFIFTPRVSCLKYSFSLCTENLLMHNILVARFLCHCVRKATSWHTYLHVASMAWCV